MVFRSQDELAALIFAPVSHRRTVHDAYYVRNRAQPVELDELRTTVRSTIAYTVLCLASDEVT